MARTCGRSAAGTRSARIKNGGRRKREAAAAERARANDLKSQSVYTFLGKVFENDDLTSRNFST